MLRRVAILVLTCQLFAACSSAGSKEANQDESNETTGSTQQASTASDPVVDAEFLGEITPPNGYTFTDLAVDSNYFYLARSDGMITLYSRETPPTYQWNIAAQFQHLEYVPKSPWYLIASDDVRRKVYYAAQNEQRAMGSYPSDVDSVSDLAAQAASDSVLNIYIVYYVQGGPRRLRPGQYNRIRGTLDWNPNSVDWGYYNEGMTTGLLPDDASKIFGISDYITSSFEWYSPDTLSKGEETQLNHTEHAYWYGADAEIDRFSGRPLHYFDGYFYCLDDYVNHISNRRATVMARLSRNALRP